MDGMLDLLCFFGAGEDLDELEGKVKGAAGGAGGDDASVHYHRTLRPDHGGAHLSLHAGVADRAAAVQQPKVGQQGGGCADGGQITAHSVGFLDQGQGEQVHLHGLHAPLPSGQEQHCLLYTSPSPRD